MSFFLDRFRGRRVLITGHTGFKGAWLALWLRQLGAEVCGFSEAIVSDPSLFELAKVGSRMRHELGDVRDHRRLIALVREFRPEYLFHLAAQAIVSVSYSRPFDTLDVNVMGTAGVLEALRSADCSVTAIIVTTDKVYRNFEWAWGYREVDQLGGKDIYSGSKSAAELVVNSYHHCFFSSPDSSVRIATVRAGNVIGGGDWAKDRIVADCIRAWQSGERVQLRNPNSTRPWQHVLEPLSGYLWLAAQMSEDPQLHGEAFNFGPLSDQNATVADVLAGLAGAWGFAEPPESVSADLQKPTFREAGSLKLDIEKAAARLDWKPALKLSEAVSMTGSWYRGVLVDKIDAYQLTLDQVSEYQAIASARGCKWARDNIAA